MTRMGGMTEDWPKIKTRRTMRVSPWMEIIEREVEFAPDAPAELYHAVGQQDYIAIVALTPEGRIPIVRQYRPALEQFTWELPAGLVDVGEAPTDCCKRELMEETGYPARAIHALGNYSPCSSRLSNRVHSFFVEAGPRGHIHFDNSVLTKGSNFYSICINDTRCGDRPSVIC